MSDASQLVVPASFIALFIAPGRVRPSLPRESILERYEFCEDMATALVETAQSRLWELGITECDVLQRIHRGLVAHAPAAAQLADLSAAEAGWIVRRLAELLAWPDPAWLDGREGRC